MARILVVDDSPDNVKLLAAELSDAGYEVFSAGCGQTALELARAEPPDLILLDVGLPGLDGFAVCRELKKAPETAAIPVLFVTGRTDAQEVVRGFEAGGCDYVTKPFTSSELLARVGAHLRLRQAEEALEARNEQLLRSTQQLAHLNEQLQTLSRLDPLTGLLNRRALEESLAYAHEVAVRYKRPYSVIMLDVDYFKRYNDACGHPAGDECLRRVAGILRESARASDAVGRYGGEEFIVLASETAVTSATISAERARRALRAADLRHPASPVGPRVTLSAGVAEYAGNTWEQVIGAADGALYQAKAAGRDRVAVASPAARPRKVPEEAPAI